MKNSKVLQSAKDDAFNLLSYRDRSQYELRKRLEKKGYNQEIVNEVVKRLSELGYIDDYNFAEKWIKDRLKNQPRGPYLIKKELEKKGIKCSIIESSLQKYMDDNIKDRLCRKLAYKWFESHQRNLEDNYKAVIRLKRYLYNKGFSRARINMIVENLNI